MQAKFLLGLCVCIALVLFLQMHKDTPTNSPPVVQSQQVVDVIDQPQINVADPPSQVVEEPNRHKRVVVSENKENDTPIYDKPITNPILVQ